MSEFTELACTVPAKRVGVTYSGHERTTVSFGDTERRRRCLPRSADPQPRHVGITVRYRRLSGTVYHPRPPSWSPIIDHGRRRRIALVGFFCSVRGAAVCSTSVAGRVCSPKSAYNRKRTSSGHAPSPPPQPLRGAWKSKVSKIIRKSSFSSPTAQYPALTCGRPIILFPPSICSAKSEINGDRKENSSENARVGFHWEYHMFTGIRWDLQKKTSYLIEPY